MYNNCTPLPLGSIAHIEMGQSPDSSSVLEGDRLGVPFLQGNAEFGAVSPVPRFSCLAPMKMCQAGDILVSVRAPVGALNIADRDYCIGRGLAAIRIPGMPPPLLARVLSAATAALRRVAQGTTFEAISKSDLLSLVVFAPPVGNYGQLTQVIDTIETTIRQTESIIEKLKRIKQGLLHDLLTRGVEANGELRPTQSQAPHLYKESPLGWIPVGWETRPLGELAVSSVIGPFGSDLVASDYCSEGVPIVFVRDVKADRFAWKSNVFVSAAKALALSAHEVRPGDVIATKMGFPPCVAAVYPDSMPAGIVTADIVRLRFDDNAVRPAWVSRSINYTTVVKQVEQITAGVTRPKVTLRDVRNLIIQLPSIVEQDRILDRVACVDQRLAIENALLDKLSLEKSGLMDDLLTGRVRVTPLLDTASVSP